MAGLIPGQLPDLLSILPFPHHTQNTESSTSSTTSAISSSQSSSTATTSASESSVTLLLSSSAIPSSTSETSSVTPTPTPIPIERTSDGSTLFVTITSSAFPSPSIQGDPSSTSNGFLQNKVLSGIVFAVVGVVALVLVVAITTIALRRSKRNRLQDEAIDFDPAFLKGRSSRDSTEKRRFSILSSDNGHSGGEGGFLPAAAAHAHQDPYYYPGSESQQTMTAQSQRPWYRGAANERHATTHVPQSESRPVWAHGSNAFPLPPSSQKTHPT